MNDETTAAAPPAEIFRRRRCFVTFRAPFGIYCSEYLKTEAKDPMFLFERDHASRDGDLDDLIYDGEWEISQR